MQHLRILLINTAIIMGGCRDRDRMVFGFTLTMQSVPITTKVVSSNLAEAWCILYNIM